MTYVNYAVVNEVCPVCGQGRVLVAAEKDGNSLFVICEDCESEWISPKDSGDTSLASRGSHSFQRYMTSEELFDHEWHSLILNK